MAKKYAAPEFEKSKRSTARITGPHARKILSGLSVGKPGRLEISGKIKSLASNEYDDSIELDVEKCEHHAEDDEHDSLTGAMKARKMR